MPENAPAPAAEPSDAELIASCRAGRAAGWSTLVRRYQRLVFTVPRRAGLDDAAAADVFQATFARLVQHLHRIADPSRVRAWLVTTAKRETLRVLEEQRRLQPMPAVPGDEDGDHDPFATLPSPDPLPEALLADLQEHDRLRRAVDRLDPRTRRFVELAFLQDEPLPYQELAGQLGIPVGSIGPTRARALAKLRALLAADGP
jgi:RNA polymerase sigma factor (sigma-70 family)